MRQLHFLRFLDRKNKREHETVAFFEVSRLKTSRNTRLLYFSRLLDSRNKREHENVAFLMFLDSKNKRAHKTCIF